MGLPHKQIFVAVGIIEYEGRFLIVRRVSNESSWHHRWNVPGGKASPGESPEETVRREVLEETGLEIGTPELLGIYTHHWQLPEHTQQTFIAAYRAPALHDRILLNKTENDTHRWVTLDEFYAVECHLDGTIEMIKMLYAPRLRACL